MATTEQVGPSAEVATEDQKEVKPKHPWERITVVKGPREPWLNHGVLQIWSTAKDPERFWQGKEDKDVDNLDQPLEEVIHHANVWIRGCNHNAVVMFQNLDPSIFDDGEDAWLVAEFMSKPPRSFLETCPGYARASMKKAIRGHPLMSQLITPQEMAEIITPADIEAEKEHWKADDMGFSSFLDGAAVFSPTDKVCSWVVWALNQVEIALWQVAWKGISLDTLVPAVLEPWFPNRWEECQEEEELEWVTLDEWLEMHRNWLGPLVEVFHRVRSDVVTSTISSGLSHQGPVQRHVLSDQHLARYIAQF